MKHCETCTCSGHETSGYEELRKRATRLLVAMRRDRWEGHDHGYANSLAVLLNVGSPEEPSQAPFPYPCDRDGWICSVCHGWNVPKDRVCMHSHLPTKLCPHGFVLADNTCGPCSEGRPNRRAENGDGDAKI